MKLLRFLSVILCGAVLLCGCTSGTGKPSGGAESAPMTYRSENYIQMIACDNESLYTLANNMNIEDNDFTAHISVYDINGNITAETTVPKVDYFNIKTMCADGGALYFAVDDDGIIRLCKWTLDDTKLKTIAEIEGMTDVRKLAISGNYLYWLGINSSNARYVEPFICKSGEELYYTDVGNTLGRVDLTNGESETLPIEYPAAFSANSKGAWVYGFDNIGGFYFAEINKLEDRRYTERIGEIMAFDLIDDSRYVFIGAQKFSKLLAVSALDGGVIAAAENIDAVFPKSLCIDNGYAYVVVTDENDADMKCVKRFYIGDTEPNGKSVKLISTQSDKNAPPAFGMETELTRLTDEEFALTVLSLDKSFDCALLSSEDSYAHDVMSKGSFYPLNDVEGVSEYLDNCHPYIKKAALTADGDIWMLPIEIDVPLLVYNAEHCANAGVEFPTDWEEFIAAVKSAGERSEYCGCLRFRLVQGFFSQYLAGHTSFDTPEFRTVAELIKRECSDSVFKDDFALQQSLLEHQWGTNHSTYKEIYDNYLFSLVLYRGFQTENGLVENDDLRAAPLPVLDGVSGNALCTFLCVNPFSERLDETLEFISQLSKRLSENKDGFMLADKSLYSGEYAQSLYAAYSNSAIIFDVPSEIYHSDFERYCGGEITLDEFIAEADRKLAAYINE